MVLDGDRTQKGDRDVKSSWDQTDVQRLKDFLMERMLPTLDAWNRPRSHGKTWLPTPRSKTGLCNRAEDLQFCVSEDA